MSSCILWIPNIYDQDVNELNYFSRQQDRHAHFYQPRWDSTSFFVDYDEYVYVLAWKLLFLGSNNMKSLVYNFTSAKRYCGYTIISFL